MDMGGIKFGTDGWRAIIAKDYTVENVQRVACGTALWMQRRQMKRAVIGYDCRFGGPMFAVEVAKVFGHFGIQCLLPRGFVSTPMVSLAVLRHHADIGVVITASHNPPEYNGFKLKSHYGGPTSPSEIAEVESLIPDHPIRVAVDLDTLASEGLVRYVDLEGEYVSHVRAHFDLGKIQENTAIAYDAMYGAGQRAMKKLFPNLLAFHCEHNPGFNQVPPEPIAKNLPVIMRHLRDHAGIYTGIATDGDADRVAMLDDAGNIIDSHHLLLLLLHYLAGYKKMTGKVVVSFSVTNKLKKLADHYGLPVIVTKIGFKYIAEYFVRDDVLVGGEESGGLAIKGHIPERDGIWIGITILEFMARTGKNLKQLIDEVYAIVGPFVYDRIDLPLTDDKMASVKQALAVEGGMQWGGLKVLQRDTLDGYKYFLERDAWLLIRFSGTEPVLRIYVQAETRAEVQEIFSTVKSCLQL